MANETHVADDDSDGGHQDEAAPTSSTSPALCSSEGTGHPAPLPLAVQHPQPEENTPSSPIDEQPRTEQNSLIDEQAQAVVKPTAQLLHDTAAAAAPLSTSTASQCANPKSRRSRPRRSRKRAADNGKVDVASAASGVATTSSTTKEQPKSSKGSRRGKGGSPQQQAQAQASATTSAEADGKKSKKQAKGATASKAAATAVKGSAAASMPATPRVTGGTATAEQSATATGATDKSSDKQRRHAALALHSWILAQPALVNRMHVSDMGRFYQAHPRWRSVIQGANARKGTKFAALFPELFNVDKTAHLIMCLAVPLQHVPKAETSPAVAATRSSADAATPGRAKASAAPAAGSAKPSVAPQAPAPTAPSTKSKKKKGKKEKQTSAASAAARAQESLGWTNEPNIPEQLAAALVAATVKPGETTKGYLYRDKKLFGLAHAHGIDHNILTVLLKARQKGNAYANLDALSPETVEELRLCDASQLQDLAVLHGVTTSLLGKLLAGDDVLHQVVDAHASAEQGEQTAGGGSDENAEQAKRRRWAEEALRLRVQDMLTTGVLKSPNYNLMHENQKASGAAGETILQRDLNKAKVAFTTDRENACEEFEDDVVALPDVKLCEPLELFGSTVHWIDAKNLAFLPDAMPAWQLEKLKRQLDKYTEKFGPGAVLWTRNILCATTADALPNVLHLRPLHNIKDAKPRKPNMGFKHQHHHGHRRNPHGRREYSHDAIPMLLEEMWPVPAVGYRSAAPLFSGYAAAADSEGDMRQRYSGHAQVAHGGVVSSQSHRSQRQAFANQLRAYGGRTLGDGALGATAGGAVPMGDDVFTYHDLLMPTEQHLGDVMLGEPELHLPYDSLRDAADDPMVAWGDLLQGEAADDSGDEDTKDNGAAATTAAAGEGDDDEGLALGDSTHLQPEAVNEGVAMNPPPTRVSLRIQLASGGELRLEFESSQTLKDLLGAILDGMPPGTEVPAYFRLTQAGGPNLRRSQLYTSLAELDLDRVKLHQRPV